MNNLNNLCSRIFAISGSLDTRTISIIFLFIIVGLQLVVLIMGIINIVAEIKNRKKNKKR